MHRSPETPGYIDLPRRNFYNGINMGGALEYDSKIITILFVYLQQKQMHCLLSMNQFHTSLCSSLHHWQIILVVNFISLTQRLPKTSDYTGVPVFLP
jgi:hypothetical protein